MRQLAYASAGVAAVGGIVMSADEAFAQPALDRVLNDANVAEGDQCSVIRINFNFPVRYISHFPNQQGEEIQIRVRPIERSMEPDFATRRESLRLPPSDLTPVSDVVFEGARPEGPTLDVLLSSKKFFRVGQGADFRSLVIALAGDAAHLNCASPHPVGASPPPAPDAQPQQADRLAIPPHTTPQATSTDQLESQVLLDSARTEMLAAHYPTAVQLLTKILQDPSSPAAPEAHELLGLARERGGQLAHAKAEYEEYLRLYPQGEGAARVRQRLAGLLSDATPHPQLREAQRERDKDETEWRLDASLSQYYFRDDTFRSTDDPVLGKVSDAKINQNELLTAVDATLSARGGVGQAKLRVSVAHTNDFRVDGDDDTSLSAAYLELSDVKQRVLTRIGRQTRSTGGVFGRFDGGLLTLRAGSKVKFNVVGGYPIESSRDLSLDEKRYFNGASIDIGRFGNWDGDLYYLQQKSHGLIDREAAGAELRYVGAAASAYAIADYDTHFKQMNIALLNSNVTFKDESTLSMSLDYRRAPMLATTNALQGQTVATLEELQMSYSPDQIQQLAEDRTAYSRTATVSVSHPFNDRFSFNADVTVANMSSTKESGGVPATPRSGNEYYYAAQLVGSSMFKEGDVAIVGVRYADTEASSRYTLDFNTRYPITRDLRVNPRLRVSYRENKNDPATQTAVRGSVRLNLNLRRHYQFEAEAGGEWQLDDYGPTSERTTGFFGTLGYRVDF